MIVSGMSRGGAIGEAVFHSSRSAKAMTGPCNDYLVGEVGHGGVEVGVAGGAVMVGVSDTRAAGARPATVMLGAPREKWWRKVFDTSDALTAVVGLLTRPHWQRLLCRKVATAVEGTKQKKAHQGPVPLLQCHYVAQVGPSRASIARAAVAWPG
jgi:hypothetical protein